MLFEPYVRFHIFSSVRVTEWSSCGVLNSSHTVAYNPNVRRAYGNSQLDV